MCLSNLFPSPSGRLTSAGKRRQVKASVMACNRDFMIIAHRARLLMDISRPPTKRLQIFRAVDSFCDTSGKSESESFAFIVEQWFKRASVDEKSIRVPKSLSNKSRDEHQSHRFAGKENQTKGSAGSALVKAVTERHVRCHKSEAKSNTSNGSLLSSPSWVPGEAYER